MELDEIKQIWRQQDLKDESEYSKSELMVIINNKMLSLEKEVRSRDRLEIIAAVVVIILFGIMFYNAQSVWTRIGSATIILSALYICYKLKAAQIKKIDNKRSLDRSMEVHLKRELNQVKRQKKLLKNVAWWYITPLTVGLLFITIGGFESELLTQIIYMTAVLALGICIWWLNQKAVKDKFEPLIQEISDAIDVLQNQKS